MNIKTILAENLKGYRKKYKLSQEELAARAQLSTRGYGKIERGEVQVSLDTLENLSRATEMSIAALLTEPIPEGTHSQKEKEDS